MKGCGLDIWKWHAIFLIRKTANWWFFYWFFPIPLKNGHLFFILNNRIKNSEPL
jgi:hypothetical protein